MDPDVTLAEIRRLATLADGHPDFAEELVEKVQALDEWLSKGGFRPADWDQATVAHRKARG